MVVLLLFLPLNSVPLDFAATKRFQLRRRSKMMVSRSRSVSRFVLITLTLVALCFIANAAGMAQTLPVTTEIPKTPLMDNGDLQIFPLSGYVIVVLSNLDSPAASRISDFIVNRLPAS